MEVEEPEELQSARIPRYLPLGCMYYEGQQACCVLMAREGAAATSDTALRLQIRKRQDTDRFRMLITASTYRRSISSSRQFISCVVLLVYAM